MEVCEKDKSNDDVQEPSLEDKFSKLFCELEHCNEDEQKVKIEEMNEIIEEMNEEELLSISSIIIFNKMNKMIEEKKMTMENTILLLKHVGYCNVLKNFWNPCFEKSSLGERFKKMIFEEEKKEEKNEKLLVDLCECYLFFYVEFPSSKFLSICMSCLLKLALKKEESEETQKEVEIALLTLSKMGYGEMKQEQYLKEITEIIEHQQKHRNLTQLAFQSAWSFLIYRFWDNNSLEEEIVNELHFGREAVRELEELTRNVNWKKKEEEMSKEEAKKGLSLKRWVETIAIYFFRCELWNEENVELINSIVQIYRAAKDNCRDISSECIHSLRNAAKNRVVKVEDLLKSGAIDAILEEMQLQTLDDAIVNDCFQLFVNVSIKLKEKNKDEMEEEERKATKKEFLEKMEEEGYEDTITSFHKIFEFLNKKYYDDLSLSISNYLVNI